MNISYKPRLIAHKISSIIWFSSLIAFVALSLKGYSAFAQIFLLIAFASSAEFVGINNSLTAFVLLKIDSKLNFLKIFSQISYLSYENLTKSKRYKLLNITASLFSTETQKEVFFPAMADWDEEIFEALKKDKDAKLFMIHLRNIYAFISAMWQKSPIGDLIEFVRKLAC